MTLSCIVKINIFAMALFLAGIDSVKEITRERRATKIKIAKIKTKQKKKEAKKV